jgi:hypothetical protein
MRKFAFGMSKIVKLRIGMIFMRWSQPLVIPPMHRLK